MRCVYMSYAKVYTQCAFCRIKDIKNFSVLEVIKEENHLDIICANEGMYHASQLHQTRTHKKKTYVRSQASDKYAASITNKWCPEINVSRNRILII